MAKTLQDRLKQRRSSNFVGREQQLELFRQNLRRSLDSEDYYFIFSVHGQGGVGKTTLLKKYRSLAKEADALTAYTNEETKSIPEVLARFAQQLKEQDAELTDFDKRYKVYLQEKKRLEADPEAPKGAWQLGGRLIARSSKRLAKEFIPGSGLLLEGMDADAIGDQMGEWASFVKKRLTNKDEVQLLLQPVETLTPLFLKGLEKYAKNHRICLCFDTYEETDLYLDEWLRKLLEGQYGDAPENLLFVIAGREPLNPNAWSEYGDFIATIPLEAFSELEAKTYLERKGITDEAVVDSILGLSGRLPVLLATLAEAAKHATGDLTDPCATAVERFLKWIDDPVQRDLALHAALPRKLNQDIIQCLLPEGADAKALFQWLSAQPFVQKDQGGYWVYHSVVRGLMLRHQFQLSQDTWSALHSRIADLYDSRANNLGIVGRENQFFNEEWLANILERGYHRLCAGYQRALPDVVADFVTVFRLKDSSIAAVWAEIFKQSGNIWGRTKFGALLTKGIASLEIEKGKAALDLFQYLTKHFDYEERNDSFWLYKIYGNLAVITGNTLQIIDAFQNAIKFNPEYADAYFHLGLALAQKGDLDNAIKYFQNAIKFNPEHNFAYYDLGRALRRKGDFDNAVKNLQNALTLNPESTFIYFDIGLALTQKGDVDNAIKNFQSALKFNPEHAETHYILGLVLEQKGDIDNAIKNFQNTLKFNPEHTKARYRLGLTLAQKGDIDNAIKNFQSALKFNPEDAEAHYRLGLALAQKGDIDNAIKNFQSALKFNPEHAEAHYMLGLALVQEDIDNAIKNFQSALKFNPEHAEAHYRLGLALAQKGDVDNAIRNFQNTLKFNPEHAKANCSLGLALAQRGDVDNAIKNFQSALKFNPEHAEAHYMLGLALAQKGDIDNAIKNFQSALKFNPEHAEAHYRLGLALAQKGDIDNAIKNFQIVLKLNPEYVEAYFYLAGALKQKGDVDNAIKNFQNTLKFNPEHAEAHYNLGLALAQKGDFDNAIRNFQSALKFNPEYSETYFFLGLMLKQKGDINNAIKNFQIVIKLTPEHTHAYYDLASALKQKGDIKNALDNYLNAIKFNPEYVGSYISLGNLYLNQGKTNLAQEVLHKALEIAPKDEYALMNVAHVELASKNPEAAMVYYRKSRTNYHSLEAFFQALEADYEGINFKQYNIPKTEYLTLIQQLKDEINYTK